MIYSHETAFILYKYFHYKNLKPGKILTYEQAKQNYTSYTKHKSLPFLPTPIHRIVFSNNQSFRSTNHACHYYANADHVKFYSFSEGVILPQPEAVLAQLAATKSPSLFLMTMLEFCGTYSKLPECYFPYIENPKQNNIKYDSEPLTSIEKIQNFIAESKHHAMRFPGTSQLEKLIPFCADGSASPQESQIICKICMAHKYGGLGIKGLLSNFPISVEVPGYNYVPYNYFADFCLPEKSLILEYDSDQFHSTVQKIQSDKNRRDNLILGGWKVFSLTSNQVNNQGQFNIKFHQILKSIGIRLWLPHDFPYKQNNLFAQLKNC